MSVPIQRLVLDVLKPHEPDTVTFATAVAGCAGVEGVNVALIETDREVQNLKVTLEGSAIDVDAVEETVADLGGTVHSIDQVACGEYLVEQSPTPQDR